MQTADHIVWSVDPTALNLGTLNLPFPIAIWGLVAAVLLFLYGSSRFFPKAKDPGTKGRKPKKAEPETWKVAALAVGSLIAGQLLFLILPSPDIGQIGPIQIRWYGALFAGAFITGYMLMQRMYETAGRTREELDRLLTYILIATIIGARLGHIIFYDLGFYMRNPGEILAIWHGGLASHGAAIGILLAMYLYIRKTPNMSFWWLADRIAIGVAIGGAFIRTGNFFNSEIIGEPSDLPWAIVFSRVDLIPRHPTMLYEALLCLVIFAGLWVMYKRYNAQPPEGALFGSFLVTLFGGRFLLEFTKVNQASFTGDWAINMGQWLSIPLVILGIWLLWKKVSWKTAQA